MKKCSKKNIAREDKTFNGDDTAIPVTIERTIMQTMLNEWKLSKGILDIHAIIQWIIV